MKKLIFAIAFVAIGMVSCKKENKETKTEEEVKVEETVTSEQETTTEAKQPEGNVKATSVVEWKGTKPTGAHNGTVSLSNGNLTIENEKITGGEFTIDLQTIKCLDIPETEKGNADLVGHLKSGDFFDVEKFPTAKFTITEVKEEGDKLNVTGNLAIKDSTKTVSFPAKLTSNEGGYNLTSEPFKIDRTEYGITYKSKRIDAALKDKFIDDLMEFVVKVDAKK